MSRSDRTIVAALSEQGGSALKQIQYNEEGNAVKDFLQQPAYNNDRKERSDDQ
jgi:hypothetical protein